MPIDYSKWDAIQSSDSEPELNEQQDGAQLRRVPDARAGHEQVGHGPLDVYDQLQASRTGEHGWTVRNWNTFINSHPFPLKEDVSAWISSDHGQHFLDDYYCGGHVLLCYEEMKDVYQLGHPDVDGPTFPQWTSKLEKLRAKVKAHGGVAAVVQNFRVLKGVLRSKRFFGADRPEGLLSGMVTEEWTDDDEYRHHEYMHWIADHPFPPREKVMRFFDEYKGDMQFPHLSPADLQTYYNHEAMKAIYMEGAGSAIAKVVANGMSGLKVMQVNHMALCTITRTEHYFGKRPPAFVDITATVHLQYHWADIHGWMF